MKKLILSILCIILFQSYGFAISYEDLNTIKEPAYRFGTTDEVENPMDINTTMEKKAVMSDSSVEDANLTYADLSIKRISKEISRICKLIMMKFYQIYQCYGREQRQRVIQ